MQPALCGHSDTVKVRKWVTFLYFKSYELVQEMDFWELISEFWKIRLRKVPSELLFLGLLVFYQSNYDQSVTNVWNFQYGSTAASLLANVEFNNRRHRDQEAPCVRRTVYKTLLRTHFSRAVIPVTWVLVCHILIDVCLPLLTRQLHHPPLPQNIDWGPAASSSSNMAK